MHGEDGDLFRRIVDAVPGGVVHVAKDGAILHANAAASDLLGLRYDELAKMHVAAFETVTCFEDGTVCPASEYPVSRTLVTGAPSGPLTLSIRRPDGDVRWAVFRAVPMFNDGAIDGACVTFLDVTESKRTECALRASEAKWRTLVENLHDFVLVVGGDGRILSVNRVLAHFAMAEIIGSPAEAYVLPLSLDEWRRCYRQARDERKPTRQETRGEGPDGRTSWYESLFIPLPDAEEQNLVMIMARDVTERRQILSSLAGKERLASVGMVASSVAHEVMNPLTYVLANLDLAKRELKGGPERVDKAIAQAHEGAMRMRQIVWDLRSLGRAGSEELLYVDTLSVMETAVRLSGLASERSTEVSVEIVDPPGVLASESRLCQVFINLLVNAAQAMNDLPTADRKIAVSSQYDEPSGLFGIAVKDGGCGIPKDKLMRIFDAFYTTKEAGSGLGLSISRDIVERMHGKLEVVSTPGVGTTFTVWLPTRRSQQPAVRRNADGPHE